VKGDRIGKAPLTLRQVEEKLLKLEKPPPRHDESYLRDVCGLPQGDGVNPHTSKEKRDIPAAVVLVEFGKPAGRSGFRIGQCTDPVLRKHVQRIWSLCYRRTIPSTW
jgi:hypothetical protein